MFICKMKCLKNEQCYCTCEQKCKNKQRCLICGNDAVIAIYHKKLFVCGECHIKYTLEKLEKKPSEMERRIMWHLAILENKGDK